MAFFRFLKKNWSWFLAWFLTIIFMTIMMIMLKVSPFGDSSFTVVDSIHQYVPFFSDYQNKLRNFESLFYTWDVGLGQNFQSLLLYYMASPLNLLVVFCTRRGIIGFMSLLIAFKISLSAAAFGYYLSRRRDKITNNFLITALSLGYALNNYMTSYYWNIMWQDCIMVLPLIILGYERLMRKKDPRLYALALFYSMFCNYYISFIICIFLVLWFLAHEHKGGLKGFLNDLLRFAAISVMAAGMAALSLIVAFLAIMTTASAGAEIPKWQWYQSFWELLQRILFLTRTMKMNSFDGDANLYCGTLPILMLAIYILSTGVNLREKIGRVCMLAIFIISMNNELLNFIWHGFHNQYGIPNRFSFLYIFLLLVICYEAVVNVNVTHYLSIVGGVLLTTALMMMLFVKTDLSVWVDPKRAIIISSILVAVYAMFILFRRLNTITARMSTVFISIVMMLEILLNAGTCYLCDGVADGGYYMQYTKEMQKVVGKIDDTAAAKGLKFYRQDIVDPIMLDENTLDNIKGVGTFCTTVRGDMVKTMSYLGFYTGANEYLYLGTSPATNDMLGVRYMYVREDDYFPMKNDYTKVLSSDTVTVYENESALPLAYGVDRSVSNWEYENHNSADVINDFVGRAAYTGDIYKPASPLLGVEGVNCSASWSEESPNVISYSGGTGDTISLIVCFSVPQTGRYFTNIRANSIESIDYYLNDEKKAGGRYQTQLMDLGELLMGDMVRLDIKFNDGYSPAGTVSMFTSIVDKMELGKMRTNLQKNALEITELEDAYVKGNITLEQNQLVFTSIPYDEGWKVYVDGKKVDTYKIGGAFLAFDAEEGGHTVEMKFVPRGMLLGIIISCIFWLLYIYLWRDYTKKERQRIEEEKKQEKLERLRKREEEKLRAEKELEIKEEADKKTAEEEQETDEVAVKKTTEEEQESGVVEESGQTDIDQRDAELSDTTYSGESEK